MLDGAPHEVLEAESTKPGKGQAFTRLRLRHLLTGRVNDKTIKSAESFEAADVQEKNLQYLYRDADGCVFMAPDTYEQHTVADTAMADAERWLQPQDSCKVLLYNGQPVRITPPPFVEPRDLRDRPRRARRYRHRRQQARDPVDRRGGARAAVHRGGRGRPGGYPDRRIRREGAVRLKGSNIPVTDVSETIPS